MRLFLLILLALTFSTNEAHAQAQCSRIFNALRTYRGHVIREVFEGHIVTHRGKNRSMFVKIEKPENAEPSKWLFLVHGLLDSHVG
ncbi:MAG: hypothetical protein HRT44_03985 [Bdellovibrionales bacterium]|nr:hypothetical protein [Bdellovibrionales bacterium]NQZ18402.1 hypothetical protein [Bdellovibrionales bacterium]